MRVYKPGILSLIILVGAAVSMAGELRVWTDENGSTVEAEYIRTQDGRVVLRKNDGVEMRVSLDTLSERDRDYVALQHPPRISISVSPKSNRSNTGYSRGVQVTEETISVRAVIRKSSSAPYDEVLTAELVLIGRRPGQSAYVLLDKQSSAFRFTKENNSSFSLESADVNLKQVEFGATRGVEYAGYVLIVRDPSGEVVEFKANKIEFSKHAQTIAAGSKGTVFDEQFRVVKKTEQPDPRKGVEKERRLAPGRRY